MLAQIVYDKLSPYDWADDWVFYDSRFNLLRASDEVFLRFLCETIHPVVRLDSVEAREMAAIYTRELKAVVCRGTVTETT